MITEYAYFRAEGESHDIAAKACEAHVRALNHVYDLTDEVGATVMEWHYDKSIRRSVITGFVFEESASPVNWHISKTETDAEGYEAVFAMPSPGSVDDHRFKEAEETLTQLCRQTDLEYQFGCAAMPPKVRAPGIYNREFVRAETLAEAYEYLEEAKKEALNPFSKPCLWSDVPVLDTEEQIMAKPLCDAFFIRVPTDENGEARFTPPGALKMTFAEMQEINVRHIDEEDAALDRLIVDYDYPTP